MDESPKPVAGLVGRVANAALMGFLLAFPFRVFESVDARMLGRTKGPAESWPSIGRGALREGALGARVLGKSTVNMFRGRMKE